MPLIRSQGKIKVVPVQPDTTFPNMPNWYALPLGQTIGQSTTYINAVIESIPNTGRHGIRVTNTGPLPAMKGTWVWSLYYYTYTDTLPSNPVINKIALTPFETGSSSSLGFSYLIDPTVPSTNYVLWLVAVDAFITIPYSPEAIVTPTDDLWTQVTELDSTLAGYVSDGILTDVEKKSIKAWWDSAVAEKSVLDAMADGTATSRTAYDAAYSALDAIKANWLTAGNTDISALSPSLYNCWSNYWNAKVNLQTAIMNASSANATTALNELGVIADDNVLSKSEKPVVAADWATAQANYATLLAKAQTSGIPSGYFITAFNNLSILINGLNPPLSDYADDTAIDGSSFYNTWVVWNSAVTQMTISLQAVIPSVNAATTTNTALSGTGTLTVDSEPLVAGNLVMLAGQIDLTQDGIYNLSVTTSSASSTDWPTTVAEVDSPSGTTTWTSPANAYDTDLSTYATLNSTIGAATATLKGWTGPGTSGTLTLKVAITTDDDGDTTIYYSSASADYSIDNGATWVNIKSWHGNTGETGGTIETLTATIPSLIESKLQVRVTVTGFSKSGYDDSAKPPVHYNYQASSKALIYGCNLASSGSTAGYLLTKTSGLNNGDLYYCLSGATYGGDNVMVNIASGGAVTLSATPSNFQANLGTPSAGTKALVSTSSGITSWVPAILAAGTVTLVAGSATVATTHTSSTAIIQLTSQVDGGTPGFLRVSSRTPGTSFVITSGSSTDTSTVAWTITEP